MEGRCGHATKVDDNHEYRAVSENRAHPIELSVPVEQPSQVDPRTDDVRVTQPLRSQRHPGVLEHLLGLVRDALADGAITESMLRDEISQGHLRTDAFELVGA